MKPAIFDLDSMSFIKIVFSFVWKNSKKWLFFGLIVAVISSILFYLDGVTSPWAYLKYSILIIMSLEFVIIVIFCLMLMMIRKKYLLYGKKFNIKPGRLLQYATENMITLEEMKKMTPKEFTMKIEEEEKIRARFPSPFQRKLYKMTLLKTN